MMPPNIQHIETMQNGCHFADTFNFDFLYGSCILRQLFEPMMVLFTDA